MYVNNVIETNWFVNKDMIVEKGKNLDSKRFKGIVASALACHH